MKSKEPKKPARNSSGKFISDTEHLIQKLTETRDQITAKQRTNAKAVQSAGVLWRATMDRMVAGLLPDLAASTQARLKRDLLSFFTPSVQRTISDAINVKVPFWNWLLGSGAEFKKDKQAGALNALKIQLRSWLENQKPANIFAKYGAVGQLENFGALKATQSDLAARYQEISEQLAKLESVRKHYTSPNAASPPKELTEAIANSSSKLRANPSIVTSGGRSSRDDFDVIRDVYVPMVIWDSVLDRHDEVHHHHYDDYRDGGGNFGGGGASGDYPASSRQEDRGGGFEPNTPTSDNDRSDGGGGFEASATSQDSDSLGRIS